MQGIRPFIGELPSGSVIAFSPGDILVSNIRPYLKKIWHADSKGGASPDVLVLRPNRKVVLPEFLFYSLRRADFFEFIMKDVKGIKMPRGKKQHILRYSVLVPNPSIQQSIVAQVKELEQEIRTRESKLHELSEKRSRIISDFLA